MMKYSSPARFLHWLTAGLIVCQYVLAKLAERAELADNSLQQLVLLANHKSLGMSLLVLAVIRLGWRFYRPPPPLLEVSSWQQRISVLVHWSLYALILLLPITGWLMSSAKAYSISWFGLFSFVDLVAPDEVAAERFHQFHHWLAEALFVLALIHILAALKHHFWDKDSVLQRMASKGGWFIFFITTSSLIIFARVPSGSSQADLSSSTSAMNEPVVLSHLPLWKIDYSNSFIKFSGDQAGAPFEGRWQTWNADIQFDPRQLKASRFDVRIETSSVFSNDKDRDAYIVDVDFFNASVFPSATFRADQFIALGGRQFQANGNLSMKGVTNPVLFSFSVEQNAKQIVLSGTASLERLKWNIGVGDWADTSWVGARVTVQVKVVANAVSSN